MSAQQPSIATASRVASSLTSERLRGPTDGPISLQCLPRGADTFFQPGQVREDPKMGPYVEGLTAMSANSYREIERQLVIGNNARSVASTHMNDVSSRAHTIFSIKFSQTMVEEMGDGVARETKKVSKINLVDLAGSERQSNKQLSASEQARFKEGIAINKSLSALSNCIFALFKQSQEGKGGKQVSLRE